MPIVTLDDVRARQQAEVQAHNLNDAVPPTAEEIQADLGLDQKLVEQALKMNAIREKLSLRKEREAKANSANNEQRNRGQSPLPLNDPSTQPDLKEEDIECYLCNRVCLFGLIGASSTACVIALIARFILGPLGALIGLCSGALIGGLLGVVIARYTDDQLNYKLMK